MFKISYYIRLRTSGNLSEQDILPLLRARVIIRKCVNPINIINLNNLTLKKYILNNFK